MLVSSCFHRLLISIDSVADTEPFDVFWHKLLGRRVLFYYDDLQWCDLSVLSLIFEVMITMGRLPHARHRILFIGMYRDNKLSELHSSKFDALQRNDNNVQVTTLQLSSLTNLDVAEMVMTEMRLPKRLTAALSDIVHKKSSGHALFVVQFLNALVRDSIIVYSPTKRRYDWKHEELIALQTWDDVASLIVSNLSSLPPDALQALRILSCFGMKTNKSTIRLLQGCPDLEGSNKISSSLPCLVNAGILESNDAEVVVFTHDLVRKQVYLSIKDDERRRIHLVLGSFLGSKTALDAGKQNGLSEPGGKTSSQDDEDCDAFSSQALMFIATDHINVASKLIKDRDERVRFAGWNAQVAAASQTSTNWENALHYYKSGIDFLVPRCGRWARDKQELCYQLYTGAAIASLATGDAEQTPQYATTIINNVPFQESLEAHYQLITSMQAVGSKNQESIATALSVLRKLGFDIPSAAKLYISYILGGLKGSVPSVVKKRIEETDEFLSGYDSDDVTGLDPSSVDKSKRQTLLFLDSIIMALFRMRNPFIHVLVCETVKYSFQQGLHSCAESAMAFVFFGYLKLWIEDNYEEACRWGKLAQRLDRGSCTREPFVRAHPFDESK